MVQTNSINNKLLIICGPTAVGKSSLGIECALKFNGEIISADCEQIYKGLDIGSAKVNMLEQSKVKHHMINICNPQDNFSVAEFRDNSKVIINELYTKNKLPIVVGGTGLYIKSLLYPFDFGNSQKNEQIREKYQLLAKQYGNEYVFNLLMQVDKQSCEKLHPNDIKRVIRALEIYKLTGKPKSAQIIKNESEYDYKLIFLNDDRTTLYERINRRVDEMFAMGLMHEVENLINQGLTKDNQCMQGIGYKEFFEYFDNKITYEQLVEKIKQNSRNYAKRQITWFKHMQKSEEYNIKNIDKILKDISNWLST